MIFKPDEAERRRPGKPDDLEIRSVRVSDAEAIAALANLPGYRAGTLRLPFQTIEGTRARLENRSPTSVSLVATVGSQIVGNAGLQRHEGRQIHVGHIGMGVHDDFTGRGIGTALMAALVDTADNWLQIKRLELTVYADNAPAVALYRKFGFETEGTLRAFAYRDGAYADAYTMARLRL
jgi:putative acetyltransferase